MTDKEAQEVVRRAARVLVLFGAEGFDAKELQAVGRLCRGPCPRNKGGNAGNCSDCVAPLSDKSPTGNCCRNCWRVLEELEEEEERQWADFSR